MYGIWRACLLVNDGGSRYILRFPFNQWTLGITTEGVEVYGRKPLLYFTVLSSEAGG
jgi:hypothetical protein